jgi:hypothetical protein
MSIVPDIVEPGQNGYLFTSGHLDVPLVPVTIPDRERIRAMNREKSRLIANQPFHGFEGLYSLAAFTTTSSFANKCISAPLRLLCARVTGPKRFRAERLTADHRGIAAWTWFE